MEKKEIGIASFDIGKINFAFCIERVRLDELEKLSEELKEIPKNSRYNDDGTATERFDDLLQKLYNTGETILHENLSLMKNCDRKKTLDPEVFFNLNEVLEDHSEYWDKCDLFVIEEQMSFGRKSNPTALKIGQHCYSYFIHKYGRQKKVVEFPAKHKTQVLGAPKVKGKRKLKNGNYKWKAMDKPQRKKWAIEKAYEILCSRGEIDVIDGITTASKKDDLADVICQLQAAKYKIYVE